MSPRLTVDHHDSVSNTTKLPARKNPDDGCWSYGSRGPRSQRNTHCQPNKLARRRQQWLDKLPGDNVAVGLWVGFGLVVDMVFTARCRDETSSVLHPFRVPLCQATTRQHQNCNHCERTKTQVPRLSEWCATGSETARSTPFISGNFGRQGNICEGNLLTKLPITMPHVFKVSKPLVKICAWKHLSSIRGTARKRQGMHDSFTPYVSLAATCKDAIFHKRGGSLAPDGPSIQVCDGSVVNWEHGGRV
ncbi:hypothetical protein BKA70DRAFT_1433386 [Coprinopsis sp. MPI-PUGE-AT-0042]|nr:hypothetical protein BKA70DRAFT_1433386 [Coprinopsis sp. MPI-PUGE-AT-0042]